MAVTLEDYASQLLDFIEHLEIDARKEPVVPDYRPGIGQPAKAAKARVAERYVGRLSDAERRELNVLLVKMQHA